jgi:hypothetical protein
MHMRFMVDKVTAKQVSSTSFHDCSRGMSLCCSSDQAAHYHNQGFMHLICYMAGHRWRKLNLFVLMVCLHMKYDIHACSGVLISTMKLKAKCGFHFLSLALYGSEWSTSCFSCLIWGGRAFTNPWVRGWVVPGASLHILEKREYLVTAKDWTLGCPAHDLVTVQAGLSWVWPTLCFILIWKWCQGQGYVI